MILKVIMIFLSSISSASVSNLDGFNNTILKFKTWPIGNCSSMFPDPSVQTCKTMAADKQTCRICNETDCTIHVAVLFPDNNAYILNLNRVTVSALNALARLVKLLQTDSHKVTPAICSALSYTGITNTPFITRLSQDLFFLVWHCFRFYSRYRVHLIMNDLNPITSDWETDYNFQTEMAIREAVKEAETFLPGISFEVRTYDDGCKSEIGLGKIIDANEWCPNVIFAHTCDYTLAGVARVVKHLGNSGAPLLSPSGFTFDFTSKSKVKMEDEFYHLVNIGSAGYASIAEFLHLIADRYGWNKFAIMIEKNDLTDIAGDSACSLLANTLLNEFSETELDYQSGDLVLLNITYENFLRHKVGVNYGIILTCANHSNIRKIAITAAKLGMMDRGEYLIVNVALYNEAQLPERPWYDINDLENNEWAKKGFKSVITFYPYREANFEEIRNQSFRGSFYLEDVYESMLIYAQILQSMGPAVRNSSLKGCDTVQYMLGKTFMGRYRNITINCNAQKVVSYALVAQDEEGISKVIGVYTTENRSITMWEPGNFSFPADVPECGFDLSKCPTYDKVNILLISLISVIFIGLIIVSAVVYKHYKLKTEIYSQAWKVDFDKIAFLSNNRRGSIHSITPMREMDEMSLAGDSQLFAQIGFYNSIRVAIKKLPDIKVSLNHKQLYELKVMKDLSNDNLVKFYGACIESPNNCLLIEYCPRGSLQDILENPQHNLDWTFRMSLIMDIARGMQYLHSSAIKSHGALKSSNCLVDSRFVLKVSDFGLQFLRFCDKSDDFDKNSYEYWKRFLWTAPELLREEQPPLEGTQKGDTYSFGIVMEEIIMREGVFYLKDMELEPKATQVLGEILVKEKPGISQNLILKHAFSLLAVALIETVIQLTRIINREGNIRPD